ncbi:hypothetical protein GF373_07475, partial [bacterium]|nr:hypothetical protein [bacterium]
PDGSSIIFVSNRDGSKDLFSIGRDGTNPQKLTSLNESDEMEPACSVTGEKLYLTSNRLGKKEIYSFSTAEKGVQRLTFINRAGEAHSAIPIPDNFAKHQALPSNQRSSNGIPPSDQEVDEPNDPITVSLSDAEGALHESITLQMRIENAADLANLEFKISYDDAVLRLDNWVFNESITPSLFVKNTNHYTQFHRLIRLNWIKASGLNQDNSLAEANFEVIDTQHEESRVSFHSLTAYDIHGQEIPIEFSHGRIQIENNQTAIQQWMMY